jgi:hypothetical protein
MNRIRKIINNTFAIHAAVPAIPTKPRIPAMIAIIKKVIAHDNISLTSLQNRTNAFYCNIHTSDLRLSTLVFAGSYKWRVT